MDKRFYNMYNNNEQLESKRFGEVYTPDFIVKNMVDKIPDEVWRNKNIKILDFACGCGIFAFFIYKKLVQYFDHDYIISNILYFNDVQEKNINKIKYIFNNPKNIYQGDFLEWECDIKFDVIIGNPPFQTHNNKRSNGNSIWHKFVDKLLILLKDGGYLSLIHPPGWRKPATSRSKYTYLYQELTQKRQMIYLEMHPESDGVKNFGCYIMYDIYLVKNIRQHCKTVIIDNNGKVEKILLKNIKFIPNKEICLIYKLLKLHGNKIDPLYISSCKNIDNLKTNKYKHIFIHSIRKTGPIYKYAENEMKYSNIKKIIINPFARNDLNYLIDIHGIYGMTSTVFGLEIKNIDDATKITKALRSQKFMAFKKALTFTTSLFEFKALKYFSVKIWDEFLKDD